MPRSAFRSALSCAWFMVATGVAHAAPTHRQGSEFQVNSLTAGSQFYTAAAMDGDGDFVVTWVSNGQDGSGNAIFGQRYSSAGTPQASEFQVNSYTPGSQNRPAVAMALDGRFVVAWHSDGQDGASYGVFGQRFDAAGVAQAAEFRVNSFTLGSQASPKVAVDGDGDFVVAWDSNPQDGAGYGVFAQRFDSAGVQQATELHVSSYLPVDQNRPTIGADTDGDFVIAWQQGTGTATRIFARAFDPTGVSVADEFQVSAFSTAAQAFPALAMNGPGEFVVTWRGRYQDGSEGGIFARRYDTAGTAQAGEFQVNTRTVDQQVFPSVRMDGSGDFVVAWRGDNQDGSGYGVFARQFDASGTALTSELQVNSYTSGNQTLPTLAIDPAGDFVVAWQSTAQDGAAEGIFAQRFEALAILDIDGDGSTGALSDGLLVLRFLFGFTGNTLVGGAVDLTDCTRCDAPAIEGYLQTLI